MEGRLYRSRTDQMIGGVCGGIGAYLRIDPTLVRLFFVLLGLGSGVGVILYLVLWIIVPYEGEGNIGSEDVVKAGTEEMAQRMKTLGTDLERNLRHPNQKTGLIVGGALIVLGFVFLIDNLNLPWLRWFDFDMMWPLLLIVAGIALFWRRTRRD